MNVVYGSNLRIKEKSMAEFNTRLFDIDRGNTRMMLLILALEDANTTNF